MLELPANHSFWGDPDQAVFLCADSAYRTAAILLNLVKNFLKLCKNVIMKSLLCLTPVTTDNWVYAPTLNLIAFSNFFILFSNFPLLGPDPEPCSKVRFVGKKSSLDQPNWFGSAALVIRGLHIFYNFHILMKMGKYHFRWQIYVDACWL